MVDVNRLKTRLTHVAMETGYERDEYDLDQPLTTLYTIDIDEFGKVAGVYLEGTAPETQAVRWNADGKLAVPSFKDMHNHLDKTYMTLGWRATTPVRTLKERLAAEASELKLLAPSTEQRATKMIKTLMHRGVSHIRTHVNIDPYVGLDNLEGVLRATEKFSKWMTFDIVAFPQHGLLRDDVPSLMREAMRAGATHVGGLDPAGIDFAIERSLTETMEIATQFDADVDIHLHDRGHVGTYTYDKWLDLVEAANYKGKTAISHGFSLGDVSISEQDALIERITEQEMMVLSTIPFSKKNTLPPIDNLRKAGGRVFVGCDGFFDSWSSYVSSDILEKVNNFCQLTGKITEKQISSVLDLATRGMTSTYETGEPWLKVGDEADMVLTEVASSAELIARLPQKRWVILKGEHIIQ